MTWSRRFEDPIPAGDKLLRTLRDAGNYIAKLPRAQQQSAAWQTAAEVLIMAAEGRGPLMHARIGILRALNEGRPVPSKPARRKRARTYRIIPAISH